MSFAARAAAASAERIREGGRGRARNGRYTIAADCLVSAVAAAVASHIIVVASLERRE